MWNAPYKDDYICGPAMYNLLQLFIRDCLFYWEECKSVEQQIPSDFPFVILQVHTGPLKQMRELCAFIKIFAGPMAGALNCDQKLILESFFSWLEHQYYDYGMLRDFNNQEMVKKMINWLYDAYEDVTGMTFLTFLESCGAEENDEDYQFWKDKSAWHQIPEVVLVDFMQCFRNVWDFDETMLLFRSRDVEPMTSEVINRITIYEKELEKYAKQSPMEILAYLRKRQAARTILRFICRTLNNVGHVSLHDYLWGPDGIMCRKTFELAQKVLG